MKKKATILADRSHTHAFYTRYHTYIVIVINQAVKEEKPILATMEAEIAPCVQLVLAGDGMFLWIHIYVCMCICLSMFFVSWGRATRAGGGRYVFVKCMYIEYISPVSVCACVCVLGVHTSTQFTHAHTYAPTP